jgi:Holliday junction resolvase RusA-like endonuclease
MGYQNRYFRFTIYGKAPLKRRPRGRTHYTPKATVLDEQRVRDNFLQTYPEVRSEKRFSVTLKIFTNRNLDGDNVEKAVLDALVKVLWENDRQVKQMWWVIQPIGHLGEPECVKVEAMEIG